MSTEEIKKKAPYNLREKKEKDAKYRSLIRPALADELYDKILKIVVAQKSTRTQITLLKIGEGIEDEYSLSFSSYKLSFWHELLLSG